LSTKEISVPDNKEFELIDHTADIGVRSFGDEPEAVFENAVRGMYSIIFFESVPSIEKIGEYDISLQATDLDQLLIDWLNELLFIFSTKNILISEFDISIIESTPGYELDAKIFGQELSEEQLIGIREIKAVTYHLLSIKKTKNWQAQVIFDI
jgi:SHS2 domain-containing protein